MTKFVRLPYTYRNYGAPPAVVASFRGRSALDLWWQAHLDICWRYRRLERSRDYLVGLLYRVQGILYKEFSLT